MPVAAAKASMATEPAMPDAETAAEAFVGTMEAVEVMMMKAIKVMMPFEDKSAPIRTRDIGVITNSNVAGVVALISIGGAVVSHAGVGIS
jgi:hypothetical protein